MKNALLYKIIRCFCLTSFLVGLLLSCVVWLFVGNRYGAFYGVRGLVSNLVVGFFYIRLYLKKHSASERVLFPFGGLLFGCGFALMACWMLFEENDILYDLGLISFVVGCILTIAVGVVDWLMKRKY